MLPRPELERQLQHAGQAPVTKIPDEPTSGGVSFGMGREIAKRVSSVNAGGKLSKDAPHHPQTSKPSKRKRTHDDVEEVSSDSIKEVFHKTPTLALDSLNQAQRAALQHPGLLTNSALVKMSEFLGTRIGASSSVEQHPILPDPIVNTYLLTAFLQRYNEQLVGMRT
eukprot:4445180-Amphidinium_carterae.1